MMVALLDSLTRLVMGQVRSVDAMGTRSKESVNSTQSVCDVCCVVLGDHRPRVLPLTVDDISAKARASAVSGSFFSSTARVGGSSCWDRSSWAAGMGKASRSQRASGQGVAGVAFALGAVLLGLGVLPWVRTPILLLPLFSRLFSSTCNFCGRLYIDIQRSEWPLQAPAAVYSR